MRTTNHSRLLVAIIAILLLAQCNKQYEVQQERVELLIGTWEGTTTLNDHIVILELTKNGPYHYKELSRADSTTIFTDEGQWTLQFLQRPDIHVPDWDLQCDLVLTNSVGERTYNEVLYEEDDQQRYLDILLGDEDNNEINLQKPLS